MSLSQAERETVIQIDEEVKRWKVYSIQQRMITKLLKVAEPTKVDAEGGHYFELDFNQVSFRQKSKPREYTEEQRQELRERAKKMQEGRKRNEGN